MPSAKKYYEDLQYGIAKAQETAWEKSATIETPEKYERLARYHIHLGDYDKANAYASLATSLRLKEIQNGNLGNPMLSESDIGI